MSSTIQSLTTNMFLERYILNHTLGSGGFGLVISAYDNMTKSNRAVKLIPFDTNDRTPDFKELKIIGHVTALRNKIPTLCEARDFALIIDRGLCDIIPEEEFNRVYCGPSYDEITGFMIYTMPIYTPLNFDFLAPDEQASVNLQIKTTIDQLRAHNIREYDIITQSDDVNVMYKNIMFMNDSRSSIVIIDLDLFEVDNNELDP